MNALSAVQHIRRMRGGSHSQLVRARRRLLCSQGKHTPLVSAHLFQQTQEVFRSFNRNKYRRHNFAFAGLLKCAHDDCTVTAGIQKQVVTGPQVAPRFTMISVSAIAVVSKAAPDVNQPRSRRFL